MKEDNIKLSEQNFDPVENLTFEQALAQLESIVQKLENGAVTLESSINYYERGILLKNYCENLIKTYQMRISKITQNDDDSVSVEDIDI